MYVEGPYKEMADILNDWKCGDPEPVEERVPDLKVGDVVEIWWCAHLDETRRVQEKDIEWVKRMMNDPENDTWEFRKITSEEIHKNRPKKLNDRTEYEYYMNRRIGKWL